MGPAPVVRSDRHPLLTGLLFLLPVLAAADPAGPPPLVWHDATGWGVEGRAWGDLPRGRWYDRLPAIAEGRVSAPVWELSHDSAGMMVRFRTDATAIWVHYVLSSARLADVNMPATGVSGVDLYARDESGQWRWVGVTKPESRDCTTALVTDLAPGLREYSAYLPLRNGVDSLAIGVPAGARFEGLPPRDARPIVFYGTSITHGYSASRPGMTHVAILGRHLDRPVINLGFNGNGKMEAAVGELLCQIDAAAYVIDCLPNMEPEEVRQRCPPLVRMLRAARPKTPIVLVEDRRNANAWIRPARDRHHTDNHAALREVYAALVRDRVGALYYIPGDHLYGDDNEGSTDGSHPSDLGFMRQAAVFEPVLRAALAASGAAR